MGFHSFNSTRGIWIYHLSRFTILHFRHLPRILKLFTPLVACPSCSYANDEMFKFSQQCGYRWKRAQENEAEQQLKKVVVQESAIFERVEQLAQQHQSSHFVRPKSALEQGLSNFLFSLSLPQSIATALPTDVVAFLVWKDRGGLTRVHQLACQRQAPCYCHLHLAHGTVDSLIGKLRSIFVKMGDVLNGSLLWGLVTRLQIVQSNSM